MIESWIGSIEFEPYCTRMGGFRRQILYHVARQIKNLLRDNIDAKRYSEFT